MKAPSVRVSSVASSAVRTAPDVTVVDLEPEATVTPQIGAAAEPAKLGVDAIDVVESKSTPRRQPAERQVIAGHRRDQTLDTLVGDGLINVTRSYLPPAVQRIARSVDIVLESGTAIGVAGDAGDAGVVARREPQVRRGESHVEREVRFGGERKVEVRARGYAVHVVRSLFLGE